MCVHSSLIRGVSVGREDLINVKTHLFTAILGLSFALNILALAQVFGIAYFIPKTKKVTKLAAGFTVPPGPPPFLHPDRNLGTWSDSAFGKID